MGENSIWSGSCGKAQDMQVREYGLQNFNIQMGFGYHNRKQQRVT